MVKKFIGIFIVFIGILLLLSNIDVIRFKDYIGYLASTFLMFVGVIGMYERKKFDVVYFLIILFGLSWSLNTMNLINRDIISVIFFPVIIIVLGIRIINFNVFSKREVNSKTYTSIFGGLEEVNNDKEFTGCDVVSIFGGGTIDFTNVKLKEDKAIINVIAIFGGNDLIFNKKHSVSLNGTPIFGGVENKLDNSEKTTGEIIINYIVVFGGVEIKN